MKNGDDVPAPQLIVFDGEGFRPVPNQQSTGPQLRPLSSSEAGKVGVLADIQPIQFDSNLADSTYFKELDCTAANIRHRLSQFAAAGETTNTAVIFGATSAIGQAVARLLAQRGDQLILIARDADKLQAIADKLNTVTTEPVSTLSADLADVDGHAALVDIIGQANAFWFFYGDLPNQVVSETDWQQTVSAFNNNFLSVASLLHRIVGVRITVQSRTSIVVLSSAAGDVGRKSNYVYGSAKGALTVFCQGLRNRLHGTAITLLTVKPGRIDTPMTAHMPKTPAFLWSTPEAVALSIVDAESRRKNSIYTPWYWRYILLIIKSIPESLSKRLSL
ncbi:MAG: SDR family NAD(P)-dependent oxidoreductase [Granulosicoccus sp.]